jgi:UTP--glucose-1-phosphate uridylyltransferase
MPIKKAIITAAGWGTRFLPITKTQPKEMLPIFNRPAIQYSVEDAIACGVEMIVIVTAFGKTAIENYFDRSFELETMLEKKGDSSSLAELRQVSDRVDICYVRQQQQLGLGHAVWTAKKIIGEEPFLLLLPDDIFQCGTSVMRGMLQVFQDYGGSVLAVQQVAPPEVERYGIIKAARLSERVYAVSGLVEKPARTEAPSDLAIMGRYILEPAIFTALQEIVPGKNGEMQLTDALQNLLDKRQIYAYQFEGERYDAGTPLGLLKTSLSVTLADPNYGPELRDYLRRIV